MKKTIFEKPQIRNTIAFYQNGMITSIEVALAVIDYHERKLITREEADYLLENIKKMKKIRLY